MKIRSQNVDGLHQTIGCIAMSIIIEDEKEYSSLEEYALSEGVEHLMLVGKTEDAENLVGKPTFLMVRDSWFEEGDLERLLRCFSWERLMVKWESFFQHTHHPNSLSVLISLCQKLSRFEAGYNFCVFAESQGMATWRFSKMKAECLYEMDEKDEALEILAGLKDSILADGTTGEQISFLESLSVASNDVDDSLTYMQMALSRAQQMTDYDERDIWDIELGIANLHHYKGNLQTSAQLFQAAFDQIDEADLDDARWLSHRYNWAQLHVSLGKRKRGIKMMRKVLDDTIYFWGVAHQKTIFVRRELADLYVQKERFTKAIAILSEDREEAGQTVGFTHPDIIAWSLHLLQITALQTEPAACDLLWEDICRPLLSTQARKKVELRDGRERYWTLQDEDDGETIKRLILMALGQDLEEAAKAGLLATLQGPHLQSTPKNHGLVTWGWDLLVQIALSNHEVEAAHSLLKDQKKRHAHLFADDARIRACYWSLLSKCQQERGKIKCVSSLQHAISEQHKIVEWNTDDWDVYADLLYRTADILWEWDIFYKKSYAKTWKPWLSKEILFCEQQPFRIQEIPQDIVLTRLQLANIAAERDENEEAEEHFQAVLPLVANPAALEKPSLLIKICYMYASFCAEQGKDRLSRDYRARCFELEQSAHGLACYDTLETASELVQAEIQLGHFNRANRLLQLCRRALHCLDKEDPDEKKLLKKFKKLTKKTQKNASETSP